MMRPELPDQSYVLRFVKKRHIHEWDKPVIAWPAFRPREATEDEPAETELSVNWPGCPRYSHFIEYQQTQNAKRDCGMKNRPEGSGFAELLVGDVKRLLPEVTFVHDPLPARPGQDEDPSHCSGLGFPLFVHEDESRRVGNLIASCVRKVHDPW